MSRNYAWAEKGDRAVAFEPAKKSKNHTLVGAIGLKGMITSMLIEGALNGEGFKVFLKHFLSQHLSPGKIVIMDNLPAHKVDGVEEIKPMA